MCLREREPLILSQQELGLNFGLVSSAQQETFLSWLPKGGAPAPATSTAAQGGECEDGKTLRIPGTGTCVGFMKHTGNTKRCSWKKVNYFPPYVPLRSVFRSFLLPPSKLELSLWRSQWLLLETSTIPALGDYQYKLTAYGFASLPHGNIFHCLGSLDTSICLKFITCSIIQTLLRENNGEGLSSRPQSLVIKLSG